MRFVTIGRTRERRSDRAAKVHCTISTRLLHLYIYSKCTGRVTSKPFCLVQFVAVSYRRYARLTLYKVIRERLFDFFCIIGLDVVTYIQVDFDGRFGLIGAVLNAAPSLH